MTSKPSFYTKTRAPSKRAVSACPIWGFWSSTSESWGGIGLCGSCSVRVLISDTGSFPNLEVCVQGPEQDLGNGLDLIMFNLWHIFSDTFLAAPFKIFTQTCKPRSIILGLGRTPRVRPFHQSPTTPGEGAAAPIANGYFSCSTQSRRFQPGQAR